MPETEPPSLETCARVQKELIHVAETEPTIRSAPVCSEFRFHMYRPVYAYTSSDSLTYEDVVQIEVVTCMVVEVGVRRYIEAHYKGVRFRQLIEFFTTMELLSAIRLSPLEEVFRVTPREDTMLSENCYFSFSSTPSSERRMLTVFGRTIEVI